jgi:hypothetical protein
VDTIIYLIAVRSHQADASPGIYLREKSEHVRLILADVNIASYESSAPRRYANSAGVNPLTVQRIHKPSANSSTGSTNDSFAINAVNHFKANGRARGSMSGYLRHYLESSHSRRYKRQQDNSLRQQIASLLIALAPYLEHTHSCSTIYDSAILNWLEARGQWDLWQDFWPYYTFTGYRDPIFVNPLLQYAHAPHYLIIGFDPYVTEFVTARAMRMKSLRLLLDYGPKGLGDYLDNLYEEYGLPASFTLLPAQSGADADWDDHPFRQVLIECSVPSVIVDYSEETNLKITNLAPGSLWLDIDGDDEKHRRMKMHFPDIEYMSLKTLWRNHTTFHSVVSKS